ncbi:hypothetical protein CQ062_13680 [Ochrobactrum sp. MYb68]|nr:hypothetical protein CQ062_13680 [Ochrobactrum sp. MYb68]
MTIQRMQVVCNELQVALAAKGKSNASVEFSIEANVEFSLVLKWRKPNALHIYEQQYEFIKGANTALLIEKARQFIAALPTAEETKFREFMGALGNVIELGRKNGVEVEFINPLTETMKRLSENALTDQRVAS